jgi:hypothetical protein
VGALLKALAPILQVLFTAILPAIFELKEKSREAVEAERDPAADDEFWSGEWMS